MRRYKFPKPCKNCKYCRGLWCNLFKFPLIDNNSDLKCAYFEHPDPALNQILTGKRSVITQENLREYQIKWMAQSGSVKF